MLIINADDFGRTRLATDRIVAAHSQGAITATSAMVFMEDSERAAELATASDIETGLHLNFTERYTGRLKMPRDSEKQEHIARVLTRSRYAALVYYFGLRNMFYSVFQAQLDEFLRLFGRAPSHFDGHHHMHLCPNMLFDRIIPAGEKIRRSFSFFPGQKSIVNQGYRWLVYRWIKRTYRTTDFLFSLPDCIQCQGFDRIAALAKRANVELETHPEELSEMTWLAGDTSVRLRGLVNIGGYSML